MLSASALTFALTDSGSAAPAQAEPFNAGTGQAIALGYKVNPTNGNLSFGITFGESIAGHQNTGATGQSRAINLGVIGLTMAAEACDGGDPSYPAEDQPQPVIARSHEEGAADGKQESEAGVIDKFARATMAPFAEAITTIAPMGDPAGIYVSGGRTVSSSGLVADGVREAIARTELSSVKIGGGAIELRGLTWQAVHRSGAVNETTGTFEMGELLVGGESVPLPSDGLEQMAALNELLAPAGIEITPPEVRVEQGIVFVDPLEIGIVQSQERDGLVGPLFSEAQPLRAAITEALIDMDCGNATYITIADIVLGSVSGAGELTLELGGVQAKTAAIDGFSFPGLPTLPPLPDLPLGSGVLGSGATPSFDASAPTPAAPAPEPAAPAAEDTVQTQSVADVAGDRGGWMALIGGGGLLLLLGTAEADRRKMQRALREIPLEV